MASFMKGTLSRSGSIKYGIGYWIVGMRDLPRKQAIGLGMAGLRKRGGCHDLTGLGIAKIACHVTVGSWRLLDPFGKHPFDLFLRALRGLLVDLSETRRRGGRREIAELGSIVL